MPERVLAKYTAQLLMVPLAMAADRGQRRLGDVVQLRLSDYDEVAR